MMTNQKILRWCVAIRISVSTLVQPLAKSIAIMVRLRSCRSTKARALGAPKITGTANERFSADSAQASWAFCDESGYNTVVSQMVMAKAVSALPTTETDWVTH